MSLLTEDFSAHLAEDFSTHLTEDFQDFTDQDYALLSMAGNFQLLKEFFFQRGEVVVTRPRLVLVNTTNTSQYTTSSTKPTTTLVHILPKFPKLSMNVYFGD